LATPFLRLPLFEGPLDLLLHLCRRHELSVADMPVGEVTEQFLAYLEVLEELEIEVAGEFLQMASLLCLIKSREILPAPDLPPELSDADDDDRDPRAELVARLLEYKRYREAARELSERPRMHREFFVRTQEPLEAAGLDRLDAPLDVDLTDLLGALRDLLERRREAGRAHAVGGPAHVRLEDRMGSILARIAAGESSFAAMFDGDRTRAMVVATFLAVLELARRRLVALVQEGHLRALTLEPLFAGSAPSLEPARA
jgi:segregation and condensation protein A